MNTQAPTLWADHIVDMPGMGPGATKAGWWVAYLNELMMLGKYDEVLKWLNQARQTGSIFAIIKAKEEMTQAYVSKKNEKKLEVKKPQPRTKTGQFASVKIPVVKKCKPEKSVPYLYTQGKVA